MNQNPPLRSAPDLYKGVPFENILACVHCGLCLDACPTYRALGVEQDSPRGRLYLMRGLWEGALAPTDEVTAPLDRCLDCRACEPACPSGVPYGELLEKTRGVILAERKPLILNRILRRMVFRSLLPSGARLAFVSMLARFFSKWFLKHGEPRWLFRPLRRTRLGRAFSLMPRFSGRSFKQAFAQSAGPDNPNLAKRVALFTGCVMDVAEEEIQRATVKLLRAAGCEVVIPPSQVCCGALHVHSGERAIARQLAQCNGTLFQDGSLAAVVTNSAGCGAQLKECHHLFSDAGAAHPHQPDWSALAAKVVDILVFLQQEPEFVTSQRWREEPVSAIYDAPCHLIHAQRADGPARALLAGLPGVRLISPREAAYCCGAAGIYNLSQPELSERVLAAKMDDIEATLDRYPEARLLLTGNPGCLFQLRHGVRRRGLPLEVMHPAVFVAERLIQSSPRAEEAAQGCLAPTT